MLNFNDFKKAITPVKTVAKSMNNYLKLKTIGFYRDDKKSCSLAFAR